MGHLISLIISALLNESFTRNEDQLPTNSFAMSLMLVKALMRTRAAGHFLLATSIAYVIHGQYDACPYGSAHDDDILWSISDRIDQIVVECEGILRHSTNGSSALIHAVTWILHHHDIDLDYYLVTWYRFLRWLARL